MTTAGIALDGLTVRYAPPPFPAAVDGVSCFIQAGRVTGLVGESGSGKTTLAQAIAGLLRPDRVRVEGTLSFPGSPVVSVASLRPDPAKTAFIFQDPASALHPSIRAGEQVAEALRRKGLGRRAARDRTLELFGQVGLRDPAADSRKFPHELSGGMQQRVMIAMAAALEPAYFIADEPTTALDPVLQARVLDLLVRVAGELGAGLVLVCHDLGLVHRYCADVLVLADGRLVESGPARELLDHPEHPYTRHLVASSPAWPPVPVR